jgi:hypothetical protein
LKDLQADHALTSLDRGLADAIVPLYTCPSEWSDA